MEGEYILWRVDRMVSEWFLCAKVFADLPGCLRLAAQHIGFLLPGSVQVKAIARAMEISAQEPFDSGWSGSEARRAHVAGTLNCVWLRCIEVVSLEKQALVL